MAPTYDADRAERVLREQTRSADDPVLTTTEIEDLLWTARVADAFGYDITAPRWTPTYDARGIDAASGRGWRWKAAKIKDKFNLGLGQGLTFAEGDEYNHCIELAEFYESVGGGGGGGLRSAPLTTPGWVDVNG